MKALLLIPLILCGCSSTIKELHNGPFPYAVTHHTRLIGIKAGYSTYVLSLGWFSETLTMIPCSTNEVFVAPIDDEFKLGQSWTDTSIVEGLTTGWKGQPPAPRYQQLFAPKQTP